MFYQCQRCGNCCRWPGHVRLTDDDVERMAAFLDLNIEDFVNQFTDLHPQRNGLVLKNRPHGECVFLKGLNTCTMQDAKPEQCSGFPNRWNFPGWKEVCEAIPVEEGS
ncbi:MAG: YkgJ family cysteine cluster protein [Verrucomicrobiota bacterium]